MVWYSSIKCIIWSGILPTSIFSSTFFPIFSSHFISNIQLSIPLSKRITNFLYLLDSGSLSQWEYGDPHNELYRRSLQREQSIIFFCFIAEKPISMDLNSLINTLSTICEKYSGWSEFYSSILIVFATDFSPCAFSISRLTKLTIEVESEIFGSDGMFWGKCLEPSILSTILVVPWPWTTLSFTL